MLSPECLILPLHLRPRRRIQFSTLMSHIKTQQTSFKKLAPPTTSRLFERGTLSNHLLTIARKTQASSKSYTASSKAQIDSSLTTSLSLSSQEAKCPPCRHCDCRGRRCAGRQASGHDNARLVGPRIQTCPQVPPSSRALGDWETAQDLCPRRGTAARSAACIVWCVSWLERSS